MRIPKPKFGWSHEIAKRHVREETLTEQANPEWDQSLHPWVPPAEHLTWSTLSDDNQDAWLRDKYDMLSAAGVDSDPRKMLDATKLLDGSAHVRAMELSPWVREATRQLEHSAMRTAVSFAVGADNTTLIVAPVTE